VPHGDYNTHVNLKGKIALVTGSAKRVGKVIATALARKGANIAVHYNTSKADAEATAAELRALNIESMSVQAELSRESDVREMMEAVTKRFGRLDLLVNNAAVFFRTPLETVNESEWDRTIDSNLKGPFLCSVHAGRRMLAQPDGGVIVSIADWAGVRPYTGYLPYCISKAGVITMTQGLARSLAPKVRVNAIGPGPILVPTDLPEEEAREIMEKTPLKRHGSPEDIAAAVVFLAESDFVTGVFLPVDGGRLVA